MELQKNFSEGHQIIFEIGRLVGMLQGECAFKENGKLDFDNDTLEYEKLSQETQTNAEALIKMYLIKARLIHTTIL